MTGEGVLSRDEMDALLDGNEDASNESGLNAKSTGKFTAYDFLQPAHIQKGRLPGLELVNERFVLKFQAGLYSMIDRETQVISEDVETLKYADLISSLPLNTSVNRIRVPTLTSDALFCVDMPFVYYLVDSYFGGPGKSAELSPEREFTPTELRMIRILFENMLKDLEAAWEPLVKMKFEFVKTEANSQTANLADPAEIMVKTSFAVEYESGTGKIQMAVPYSRMDPLRGVLASRMKKEIAATDTAWIESLTTRVKQAPVELNCVFAKTSISLRELNQLKVGDVLPVEKIDTVSVYVGTNPIFLGSAGASNGAAAVKMLSWNVGDQ